MTVDLFSPHVPTEVQEMFAWIGITLCFVQDAEKALGNGLATTFHSGDQMTIESLEAEEEAASRKTLGGLLTELRKRTEIAEDFDDVLQSFLKHRNTFVHGFTSDERYKLHDPVGRERAKALMEALIRESVNVAQVMSAALIQFVDDLGEHLSKQLINPQSDAEEELLTWFRAMGVKETFSRRS